MLQYVQKEKGTIKFFIVTIILLMTGNALSNLFVGGGFAYFTSVFTAVAVFGVYILGLFDAWRRKERIF